MIAFQSINKVLLLLIVFFSSTFSSKSQVILYKQYKSSSVTATSRRLVVSTGKVEREWEITSNGLKTIGLNNLLSGKHWITSQSNKSCDWNYEGLITDTSTCRLISLLAKQGNDEGFTSEYLEVSAEFEYPYTQTFIKYLIWAYPDAPGIRTQVWIKSQTIPQIDTFKTESSNEVCSFRLTRGRKNAIYKSSEMGKPWDASIAEDSATVEYQLTGLKSDSKYKLGLSWWDFEGEGRIQKIILTTVDGENATEIQSPISLPGYKNRQEMPVSLVYDVPSKLIRDGSIRILVQRTERPSAIVGELWLYENSKFSSQSANLGGDDRRLKQLKANTPEGFSLAAYCDCGQEPDTKSQFIYGRCDNIPVDATTMQRHYVGYFNDTQHRNSQDSPLIKEVSTSTKISKAETNNWASLLMIKDREEGFAILKESHKCVNQYGVETGDFNITREGIQNRGTSLYPGDISPDNYKWYWASWTILWSGNDDNRDLAIKQFDRLRFPVKSNREIYTMTNLWGSSRKKLASTEKNLLIEIDKAAELGIDIVQVEDGWQGADWSPSAEAYPTGWNNIVRYAKDKKVILGLWVDGNSINNELFTYQKLKASYDSARFAAYKVDYTALGSHEKLDSMIGKMRRLILYSNHRTHVNWDVTENSPRFGYFWAKEYGNVFLENRKCDFPLNVIYHPYLVLRDLWHLSKYTNLNKFQGTMQNPDRVLKELSDAYLHSHAYSVAIPMMSSPLFFEETQFRSQSAVDQIKPLLSAYKKVRNEMYECYVYPLGSEPDNHSWSGFQAYHPIKKVGYLTIFRELNNMENRKAVSLHFLANKTLKMTDLLTGETFSASTDKAGFMSFEIPKGGAFRFYKYQY